MDESDFMLPWFGVGGVIVFVIICAFTYLKHRDILGNGTPMIVAELGSCERNVCNVRVYRENDADKALVEKETRGKVFVGDRVFCGFNSCYKD